MTAPYVCNSLAGVDPSVSTFAHTTTATSTRDTTSILGTGTATDYLLSPVQASRTTGGFGMSRTYNALASGVNLVELLDNSGTAVLRVRSIGSLQVQLQYWNGSTWVAVGSGMTILSSTVYRYQVDFTNMGNASTGALTLKVITDSTEVTLGTDSASGLNLSSATNVARAKVYSPASTTTGNRLGEFFLKDGTAQATYAYAALPTSNGTDATDGTGAYTDVDDTAGSIDTDMISLPSSGNKRSFKSGARSTAGRSIKGVTLNARLRCGASGPTQCKPYLLISGTRYYHASSPVTLTTTFAGYSFTWETDPSTGAAWANAAAESANLEYGIEVV